MADPWQLHLLRQGTQAWNRWRNNHPEIRLDFSSANLMGADLSSADLSSADFSNADLSGARFNGANLVCTNLSSARLSGANLSRAKLSRANFSGTNLIEVYLSGADLNGADLSGVDLSDADLSSADLSKANLCRANLSGTNLSGVYLIDTNLSSTNLSSTNLSGATIGWTTFGDVNLRTVKGLETVKHESPSTLGIDTLLRSEGNIPESFLRGVGLTDTLIDYVRSLSHNPIEYSTCFISYSSKDQEFAEQLHANLQSQGVRCWFAPHDRQPGAFIRDRLDEALVLYDKLLLILSKHSVESPRMRFEVGVALEKEAQRNTLMLFPLCLDETVMTTIRAWAADLRRERHIGDFTHWKQHDDYQKALSRLLYELQPYSSTKQRA